MFTAAFYGLVHLITQLPKPYVGVCYAENKCNRDCNENLQGVQLTQSPVTGLHNRGMFNPLFGEISYDSRNGSPEM